MNSVMVRLSSIVFSDHIEVYVPRLINEINKECENSCQQLNSLRLQKVPNDFYKEVHITLTTYKTLKN